jgi:hypothetical protein
MVALFDPSICFHAALGLIEIDERAGPRVIGGAGPLERHRLRHGSAGSNPRRAGSV